MNQLSLFLHSELALAMMSAAAVFLAVLVVSWPYLQPNHLQARLAQVATERERIRMRERSRLNGAKPKPALRAAPKPVFSKIVDRFDLVNQDSDGELAQMLRMAGYRGRAPFISFLAVRVLSPIVGLSVAAFYVFAVLHSQHPLFIKLGVAVSGAALGYYAPLIYVKNKITKRQKAIRRAWPEALDLLLICVESGMSVENAFRKVAEEIRFQSIELAEELSLTTAEMSYLQDRRKAYENLGDRTGLDSVRGVVTSLIQAEKYGTPLAQSLRVLAQENRDTRMSEAEKKAAALPPKLTVPMIIFFLPVLFAVIITPAAIQLTTID
jgi:tight adherence protein C